MKTRLHNFIGVTGLIIPFICYGSPSISQSYYTSSRDFFVAALSASGSFFICNKGYDWKDSLIFNICGVCFFLVAFCPCESSLSKVHYIAAATLFFLLGFICLFLFTLHGARVTKQKKMRNIYYRICGISIFTCLILCASKIAPIWIFEDIMLFFFCSAFLIKGKFFNEND